MAPRERARIVVLSGPNLRLLGEREPEIYGTDRLEDHSRRAREEARDLGVELEFADAQSAGAMVELVHAARGSADALIVNPGALTHFAWSVHDALAAFDGPVVEVHLSNPATREPWRHESVVAAVASGTISGFGARSYPLAVRAAVSLLRAGRP
jgi:3-dehydroquinate dehydratase-2